MKTEMTADCSLSFVCELCEIQVNKIPAWKENECSKHIQHQFVPVSNLPESLTIKKEASKAAVNCPDITTEDVVDLVEFSINEAKPQIKTRRGVANKVEVEIGREKFVVTVKKTQMKNMEVEIGK